MKKIAIAAGLLLMASPAFAAITVGVQPVSLVTVPTILAASSTPLGLFSFTFPADTTTDTLASVTVTLNAVSGSTVAGSDIAQLAVYRDANSNGTFQSGTDLVAGTQTTVNVGAPTTITTSANNALQSSTFFVSLSSAASLTGTIPADSLTATLATGGISTTAGALTFTGVTTSTITAPAPVVDTTGPVLTTATKQTNTVTLTFGEATNKAVINAANINTTLALSNTHSWLDGALAIGSTSWSTDGKVLTITLSSATSIPTVAVGDVVTAAGSVIKDAAGNNATGSATITAGTTGGHDGDDNKDEQGNHQNGDENENDNEDGEGQPCANALVNGHLYKTAEVATVYLADHCMLKPFRGEAVFHSRGNKFKNITVLTSIPAGALSTDPALPASGTLIKGSDKTVWFVETGHKRKGFASEAAFKGLGFKFSQVNQIADSDLSVMAVDTNPITSATAHPDGALVKCTDSSTILQITGNLGTAFTNADAFTLRGHSFQQVATIDCGKFHYVLAKALAQ